MSSAVKEDQVADPSRVIGDLMTADPGRAHGLIAELRESGTGVHAVAGFGTAITRYADVAAVMADHRRFSSAIFQSSPLAAYDAEVTAQRRAVETVRLILLFLDQPTHTRLRGLMSHAFSARGLALWQSTIERVADEVLDGLASGPGGEVDIHERFSHVLPIRVISEVLGVRTGDIAAFRDRAAAFVNVFEASCIGEDRVLALERAGALVAFTEDLIAERRRAPREDLISLLISAEEQGDRLGTQELVASVAALLAGGVHTTTAMFDDAIMYLSADRAAAAALVAEPDRADRAVEEVVRLEPAGRWTGRAVLAPVDIGGVALGPGDIVWLGTAGANRDPRQFPEPDRFDADRHPNRHLGFGRGIHHCIGAGLARLQARIALPRLFGRFPGLTPTDAPPEWKSDFITQSRLHYPVRMTG